MTAPTYNHDLTNVDLAESTTGWSHWGGGNIALGAGTDFAMQGTNAVDGKITNTEKGPYFDNGSGITLGNGDHVFSWAFLATPGLSDTIQNRGLTIGLGSTSANYCKYHVEGNDTYGAVGRVGKCYAIDYSVHTTNTSPPYRTLVGSPGANPRVFGVVANITVAVKGSNLGADAIRYGTGAYLKDGELVSAGDSSDDPCTFTDFSLNNDYNDATNGYNRWGILTNVGGSLELQGRFVIGQTNAGVAASTRFEDSDVNISLVDTIHAASDFTQIVVDHASTVCNLTNINIEALGTTNPGRFVVNSANPTVTIVGGTWKKLGITTLRSNTDVTGLAWRECGQITLNSATLDSCVVSKSSNASALLTNDLDLLDDCTFESDGTGHGVEMTISATDTQGWNCTDTGYTAASSGNETIKVTISSPYVLTINVAAGASTPSVYVVGTGTVSVVSGQVTLTVTTLDKNTKTAIEGVAVTVLAKDGTGPLPYDDTVTITRSGSVATVAHTGHGLATGKKILISGAVQNEYNRIKTITYIDVNSYSYTVSGTPTTPATGTIKATAVVIDGLTNSSGVINDTRSYSTAQPVTGSGRKGSTPPAYEPNPIDTTINTANGAAVTLLMTPD